MMILKARNALAEDETNDLILEHLRQIQGKLSDQDARFSRVENRLRAIKSHVAGLVQSDLSRDAHQATMQVRLVRIERRLGLADAPAEWSADADMADPFVDRSRRFLVGAATREVLRNADVGLRKEIVGARKDLTVSMGAIMAGGIVLIIATMGLLLDQ